MTPLSGYVDLLVAGADACWVIDFKTDAAPLEDLAEAYPGYVEQVRTYAGLNGRAGLAACAVRAGLLFTADGGLRQV